MGENGIINQTPLPVILNEVKDLKGKDEPNSSKTDSVLALRSFDSASLRSG